MYYMCRYIISVILKMALINNETLIPEKLIIAQLISKSPTTIKCEEFLRCSQETVTGPCLGPAESN